MSRPTPHRLRLGRLQLIITAIAVALSVVVAIGINPPVADALTVFGDRVPQANTDSDTSSVELGVRFSSDVAGHAVGIRFYKGSGNVGPHTGTLWSSDGRRIASVRFTDETTSGWQRANFSSPVRLQPKTTYVASYRAPRGSYPADPDGLKTAVRRGHLTVPQDGGVYNYEAGGFPNQVWKHSNYWVDVVFRAGSRPSSSGSPKPSASAIGTATSTAVATSPSTSSTAPTSSGTGPTDSGTGPSTGNLADLPKLPWEGADYWASFSHAKAAGWANPSFFPIASWWSVVSTPEEVAYDKSLGLNTYIETNPTVDFSLMSKGGMYWIGDQLPNSTASSVNWVGTFLEDEADGRFSENEAYAKLQAASDANTPANTGRFRYANHTSGVLTYDRSDAVRSKFVNDYTDAISVDAYLYSVPQCDWGKDGLRWDAPPGQTAITPANCRTASSYGKIVELLRRADGLDGKRQAVWQFIEVVGDTHRMNSAKVQGAAMSSIIHGARGLVWFPQSFEGGCETGNAFRTYEFEKSACLADQVAGVKKINLFIKSMAPVLNTQSYAWSFGSDIDSMLKVYDGSAYIFAMTRDGGTGSRTFTLPGGVSGSSVEVVGENRTLSVIDGKFTDSFAAESSYHAYRIKI